jgi:sugar/nucleoside kinase (ribokinase family)
MTQTILCIGSVLWDIIGRTTNKVERGFDCAGQISMIPGGVAMNIAMRLRQLDRPVALLSYLGHDKNGYDLIAEATKRGISTAFIHQTTQYPTDRYMAIEVLGTLFGAIADANSLEAVDDAILAPLMDGRLGSATQPFEGCIILDGNLTEDLLSRIAKAPEFSSADIRLVPASPGKALRLNPFIGDHGNATLYVNMEEACSLAGRQFENAKEAAVHLQAQGLRQVIVTNSANMAGSATNIAAIEALPPNVDVKRVTGAGDVFMASHISAELSGLSQVDALQSAIQNTATYISSDEIL